MKWEVIERHGEQGDDGLFVTFTLTERSPVAGGWLVRTTRHDNKQMALGLAYVPDSQGSWK